ncbi:sensor histidine kinase [Bacillus sp. REN16]|uniref:sensor histidine kinase n=1 Tax=Bacillus sp. REN16 TaxID=2887296 RepID=UPI001E4E0FF2|nr:sensor histidine kinase [Bacillus sp. REN16]MCC3357256.1 sensor histidine kinase [Bacillus sp. REN16]
MKKYSLFQKWSGISPYIWAVMSILPFYFIFQSSSTTEIIVGLILTVFFFISLRFAFISKRWPVYLWTSILIGISLTMSILFAFIYFAFYIAYYNGNIKNRVAFLTLYIIHLVATTFSINYNLVIQHEVFLTQLPFNIIVWISVILLPFNIYNKKKQEKLEEQLEDANKRIAELVKQEERQRIARDLHDTLGQKLSMIGLKSDLARKLIHKDPEKARHELKDVQQTARTALNEVRKMVSQMRGIRIKEEIARVKEILRAANIEFEYIQEGSLKEVSLFYENIISMLIKEAINNVVKHSKATCCTIEILQSDEELTLRIKDNGIGTRPDKDKDLVNGHGLQGMRERLEFVNGSLEIIAEDGTTLHINIPNVRRQVEVEGLL